MTLRSGKFTVLAPVFPPLTAHPSVTRVEHAAGPNGALISVFGSGFSVDSSLIRVLVGGSPCNVIQSSSAELRCLSATPPVASGTRPGGIGILSKVLVCLLLLLRSSHVRSYVSVTFCQVWLTSAPNEPPQTQVLDTFVSFFASAVENRMETLEAYFSPPVTAEYRFLLTGGSADTAILSLSSDAASASMIRIPIRSNSDVGVWSEQVHLQGGRLYHLALDHKQVSRGPPLRLAVSISKAPAIGASLGC